MEKTSVLYPKLCQEIDQRFDNVLKKVYEEVVWLLIIEWY